MLPFFSCSLAAELSKHKRAREIKSKRRELDVVDSIQDTSTPVRKETRSPSNSPIREVIKVDSDDASNTPTPTPTPSAVKKQERTLGKIEENFVIKVSNVHICMYKILLKKLCNSK